MEETKNSKLVFSMLVVLLSLSVFVNVLLARKVEHLRYIERTLRGENQLQPGEIVPDLSLKGLDGKNIIFPYGDSELPAIVYVISPGCSWCEKNQKNAESLAKKVSDKYRFIAISLDSKGLEQYVKSHQISFDVYTDLPQEIGSKYKFGGTPQTLVISAQGKVLHNWQGAYTGDLKSQIEKVFDFSLPGIDSNN